MTEGVEPVTEQAATRERHATNLELFLDLVFVYAVTQIATLIGNHPSGTGTAKGLLICFLVWWLWSQFTWTGSAIDLQGETASRVMVLCLIPVTLIMTISIPDAFGATGIWFGAAYLGVETLVLSLYGRRMWADPATRFAFTRYASAAMLAPVVVLVGAFAHGEARILVWVVAAVLDLIGAARAGGGEWVIDPVHFSERHALFVIIALGEVLVEVGASATESGLRRAVAFAIVASVAVACTIWWTYFAYIPEALEHDLRRAGPKERGRLARDAFTLLHYPIVFGIILYAVVVKHLVPEPDGHLATDDRWLLFCSVLSLLVGLMAVQYRVVRRVAPERIAVIVIAAGWCALGKWLPGTVVVAGVAVLYAVMQAITLRRLRGRSRTTPTSSGADG